MSSQSILFLGLILFSVSGFSNEEPVSQAPLSPSGIRRLKENKQTLLDSISHTKNNIDKSANNQKTILEQLGEVQKIQDDLGKLKTQYIDFLESARKELLANKEALLSLDSKKPSHQGELKERKSWAENTQKKIAEVSGLLKKLEKDLAQIKNQSSDLENQKAHWESRQKYHQELLKGLEDKQLLLENKLKGDA